MFLQPEKIPVKVYLSTDKDAPRLDRTPNCVATILKACLVTGYGEKEGAGWTIPFEDNAKGIKVLKPADSPHIPFFMRLSEDSGRQFKVQVYQNMTSIDNGELKLKASNGDPVRYSYYGVTTGKWCVIANERGFWFLKDVSLNSREAGFSLFCGDTAKNTRGERAVALVADRGQGIADSNTFSILAQIQKTSAIQPRLVFDGKQNLSTHALLSPLLLSFGEEIYGLPIYFSSNLQAKNYDEINVVGRRFINHAHSSSVPSNAYVPIDFWEY